MLVVAALIGLAAGALAAWLVLRARTARLQAELEFERRAAAERGPLQEQFANVFRALSAEALQHSNSSFLELARTQFEGLQSSARGELEQRQQAFAQLVAPITESLGKMDQQVSKLDGALSQQVSTLAEQARSLANALRAPHVRGRWGEVQLRNVVEQAGMLPYCDFVLQATVSDDERLLRPDLVVRLPGGKHVVVDAKAPLAAYLDAFETEDEPLRAQRLADHARQVRDHMKKLAAKGYWRQFTPSPDFVVMFLPDESYLRAAHEHDPAIGEDGWACGVILASPSTLVTLMRTAAATWQQETIAESAREVSRLGQDLYDRLRTLGSHFARLGRSLDGAVGAYNEAVGSLESRVLVTARKLEAHGIAGDEIPLLEPVERQSRPLQALELAEDGGETLLELAPPAA